MADIARTGIGSYAACAMVAYWPGFRVDVEDRGLDSVWTFTMLDPGLRRGPSIEATIGMPFQDFENYAARGEAHHAANGDPGPFLNVVHRIDVGRKAFEEAEAREAEARRQAELKAIKHASSGRDSLQHRAELLVRNGKDFETLRHGAGFEPSRIRSSREASMRLLRKPTTFVKDISNVATPDPGGCPWWMIELGFADQPERDLSITCWAPPIESLLETRILGEAAAKPVAPRKTLKRRTDTL